MKVCNESSLLLKLKDLLIRFIFFPLNDTRQDIALAPAGMWNVLDVAQSASGSFFKFEVPSPFTHLSHLSLFFVCRASPHKLMRISPNLMWLFRHNDKDKIKSNVRGLCPYGQS